jgi:biotin synthase
MCYAIPGKVLEIKDNNITVDYFGEKRKARNEFFTLSLGDYIYAQGGFVIQKISESEALSILETWKELFFKLQEIDEKLTPKNPTNLYESANALRQKYHGNSCCIHGIIEFSNYCSSDCLYCGLRPGNKKLTRYRMSVEEILEATDYAVNKLNFKALVFQSGEDPWYTEERLLEIVNKIKEKSPCLVTLSIGERPFSTYEKLYEAGARSVLLRFETSNPEIYSRVKPGRFLENRLDLIKRLRQKGYIIMSGFILGLPGQTKEDIINDIKLTHSLGAEMFSFGPFIPHPETPLAIQPAPSMESVLNTIAEARMSVPEARILVTTALETLDKDNALRLGLMAGANSLMINVTPEKYRRFYEIYPDRAGIDTPPEKRISSILQLLQSIGRAPTDLGG